MTHQCHDVIGQIPSQVRGHKTREASEGNTCVILVGTAEILGENIFFFLIVHKSEGVG